MSHRSKVLLYPHKGLFSINKWVLRIKNFDGVNDFKSGSMVYYDDKASIRKQILNVLGCSNWHKQIN
jgi:hypothetical protein